MLAELTREGLAERSRPGAAWPATPSRPPPAYDAAIVAWLDAGAPSVAARGRRRPPTRAGCPSPPLTLRREQLLRYGENPHQLGARYATVGEHGWWERPWSHGGKELSYLNVYDTEAAWRLVHSLGDGPAAVVIKHANPCGVAVADDITTAYVRAHECDPT